VIPACRDGSQQREIGMLPKAMMGLAAGALWILVVPQAASACYDDGVVLDLRDVQESATAWIPSAATTAISILIGSINIRAVPTLPSEML
jgi:hypothetical protein